jgi:hypothetical protein
MSMKAGVANKPPELQKMNKQSFQMRNENMANHTNATHTNNTTSLQDTT